MTVSTELSHEEYTGNGVTTDFDFRFRIFEAKHLVVSVADQDGAERILTNGTDYTLRGVGSYRGGKVILKMPLATDWKIGIARDLPVVQETDLRNQGKFFAEVHEDAFDYLTMLTQKSLGYLSLCLRKPSFISDHYDAKGNKISNLGKPVKDGDAVDLGTMTEHISAKDMRYLRVADKDIPVLPSAVNRANKLLSFDDNGNPVVIVPESGSAADVLVELSKPEGAGLIGVKYKNTDTLFTLTDYIQNEVYADLFIRESERVIDGIHAACDYVESNGGGVVHLSARTYLIEDELILRDKVVIRGRGCGQWSGVTTIKWAGGNGDGKAVVRASRYPLGQEGTNAVASSGITDVFINADGCDVGLYSYYAVNRTIFDRVVSRYATKANIYINKSWFATFGNLVGLTGKDKGIVIGYPLFGETGEMNINSCTFGNLSANQNGQDTDLTKESNGVGILLGRRMAACSFSSIQAETNRGIGLVIESSYTNTINSIYLEGNAEGNSTYPSLSMFYKNSGNFGVMNIGSLYLAPRQVVRNDVDLGMVIAGMYRNDNINTFIGDGRCIITSTNLLSHGNTDWSKVASDIEILADFKSVNIQLTSEVIKNTFVTYSRTGYTFMTIAPKNNYSLSSAVVLGVDTGTTSFGTSFTKGTPVTKMIGNVTSGHHKIYPGGTQPSSETLFDVQVLVVKSRGGGYILPSLDVRNSSN